MYFTRILSVETVASLKLSSKEARRVMLGLVFKNMLQFRLVADVNISIFLHYICYLFLTWVSVVAGARQLYLLSLRNIAGSKNCQVLGRNCKKYCIWQHLISFTKRYTFCFPSVAVNSFSKIPIIGDQYFFQFSFLKLSHKCFGFFNYSINGALTNIFPNWKYYLNLIAKSKVVVVRAKA